MLKNMLNIILLIVSDKYLVQRLLTFKMCREKIYSSIQYLALLVAIEVI